MSSRSGRPSSLLLWPAGAEVGRTAGALRGPSFIPTVRSAPEWALRLHRVMRRRTLAGYTADRGFTPLPRRPPTRIAAAAKDRSRDQQLESARSTARAARLNRDSRPIGR